jgi:hypothetical protein
MFEHKPGLTRELLDKLGRADTATLAKLLDTAHLSLIAYVCFTTAIAAVPRMCSAAAILGIRSSS